MSSFSASSFINRKTFFSLFCALLPKRCRRTFCYQIAITNDSKKPWDCRKIGNSKAFQTTYKPVGIIPTQRDLNNSALVILSELLLVALISQFIRIIPAKKAPVIISLSGVITGIVASGLALYHYTDIIASFIENCNMFFKIYTQYFQKAW